MNDDPPYWIDAPRLRAALPMAAAIAAMEEGFARASLPIAPARTVVEHAGAQLLTMSAAGGEGAGTKLVTVQPANEARGLPLVHGLYVLFSPGTMEPLAVIDGAELTSLRTPAVSALATKHLAREDASRLVVFGAGVQARAHVEAMRAVRPISAVTIVEPSDDRANRLVEELACEGLTVERGEAAAVADADIVCTCTTSVDPVFAGSALAEGAHVNAMGSYQPHTREIDAETCLRSRIVLEDRAAVLGEAGDLIIPLADGTLSEDAIVADLHQVVRGEVTRQSPSEITLFKSVGVASEDLIVAATAVRALEATT